MGFTREKIRDFYLLTTDVENIFINEYMTAAPGEFVKVYLYGLLYSQNGVDMTFEQMSKHLNIKEERIEEAWEYWSKMGVVEKKPAKDFGSQYDIEFKQLRSLMYGGNNLSNSICEEKDAAEKADPLCNNVLKDLLLSIEKMIGKTISPKDVREIFSWVEDLNAQTEVILRAVEYCMEKGKTGIKYIGTVVKQWTKDGLKTSEDVDKYLESIDKRASTYKQILQTLGLNRGVTEAEKEMVDQWLDKFCFNMDRILEACNRASFISNPNLRYVNKVLQNWYEEAKIDGRDVNSRITVTQADLNRYYQYLRDKAESEAEKRKQEVYNRLPKIEELDNNMLSLGKKLSRIVLKGDAAEIKETKKLMHLLEEERAVILTENNYREDYTDIKYGCSLCNDTGITEDGARCSCVKKRMGEAEVWQNLTSSKK